MNKNIVLNIKNDLNDQIDFAYKEQSYGFFKEKINILGVRASVVKKISKKYFAEIKDLNKGEILLACEQLLELGYGEYNQIAFDWAFRLKNEFEKEDFRIFEKWLKKYVSNWGACDDFCTHAFGYFIFKFPEFLPQIMLWARSSNRWLRRASAVVLIYSLRRKKYLENAFAVADILLEDKDDLVRKGYGWMLKEASNLSPNDVFAYVMKNKTLMPRVALRYAVEKLPEKMKKDTMKK